MEPWLKCTVSYRTSLRLKTHWTVC